ncbi:phosphoribosyltransferase domain-containing protein [Croceicoccus marinus]|uniref:Phosphoribosyltransferase domain-containing protein n=1 Tax=Croceicoccus marinus TaxID=450378 RepID=A0A1Z1FAX7_9SPHN|nr:phosphoribosyltransferase domain-containing protein [Croceicoccus marinus]ARU15920.1 hypothetical protein A9D14_06650 [Croceicoccus marinus]
MDIALKGETRTIELRTGTLKLTADNGPPIGDLCRFAARANPKRGFLIVSKVLGRHLPARPTAMRRTMRDLADQLEADLPGPVVFLGMAETATALGQGVFAAYQERTEREFLIYLQTSRQRMPEAHVLAEFEEGHSHATTHMIQIAHPCISPLIRQARTLVIIDDESSTGNTFLAAAEAMRTVMPQLERIETVCITDWSGGDYLAKMPLPAQRHSILSGRMEWTPSANAPMATLAAGSNKPGSVPAGAMQSRGGLMQEERAERKIEAVARGERILVLGEGEHSYEALLIAETIERQGGIAAVQCITRSPALEGHAMRSISNFEDSYGSGAPCFLYNILSHQPDRIIIAAEISCNQAQMARDALEQLGADVPIELVHCRYGDDA